MARTKAYKLPEFNEMGCRELLVESEEIISTSDMIELKTDDGDTTVSVSVGVTILSKDGRRWTATVDVELYPAD